MLQTPHDIERHKRRRSPGAHEAQRLLCGFAMKKLVAKLKLQRETLRALTQSRLREVAGGNAVADSCTGATKLISGCLGGAVPDPHND